MLISKQHKFIFIHIYKTAGSSITAALLPYAARTRWKRFASLVTNNLSILQRLNPQPFRDHINASEIIDTIGRKAFDDFFSFAFVRNPWDWQVSLYNFMLKNTTHHQHDLAKSFGSFDAYIRWRCQCEVRFQKDFIYSADGTLLVNFVGRYENLHSDFETICSRIGISASLPKLNVSNTKPYREFYTDETEKLVRQTFDTDIKLLGYDF